MSLPYLDQLDSARHKVFEKLVAFSKSFILGGGTALMLRIGHRFSYDFDCFTKDELPDTLARKARKVFGLQTIVQLKSRELYLITTPEGVDIHFVSYPYIPLITPEIIKPISVFSLEDIAADKAFTIGRRGAWRDYVDLYFILKKKLLSITQLIDLAERKYPGEFNDKLFCQQLTYFDDLEILPTRFIHESATPAEIQFFLKRQTALYVKKILR